MLVVKTIQDIITNNIAYSIWPSFEFCNTYTIDAAENNIWIKYIINTVLVWFPDNFNIWWWKCSLSALAKDSFFSILLIIANNVSNIC